MNIFFRFIKPIIVYPIYFVFFFLLIGIPEIYSGIRLNYIITDTFNWAIINLAASVFVITYIFSLILFILPSKSKIIYEYITLCLAVLHFIGSIFLISMYGYVLNDDIMSVILNSNKEEIVEYLSMYLSAKYFLLLIILLCGAFASYHLIKTCLKSIKCNCILVGALLIVSAGLTIRRPVYLGEIFHYKYIKGFNPSNKVPDLSEYAEEIHLISFKDTRPSNVVLIIGESFSKYHSSLYGYEKNTNPLLSKYRTDSLLYIYSNVTSPALNTIPCFQSIMSTYKPEFKDSIAWYKCTTLIDVVKKANYNTFWISNQSKRGIYDNIPSRYAELCDTALWVGDKQFVGMYRTTFDEELIPLVKPLLVNKKENNFYVCHLMGSHYQFRMRYPHEYERFNTQNYVNYPEFQRKQRASYDNSILYNDSVVYELMNLFMDKEAIVFYFPDHSIDVYQSSNKYIGHASYTNPKSADAGRSIPFMIFTTPLYQKRFPLEMEMIKKCTQQPFRTDDMIYTIMDLVGISLEGEKLDGKSLFRYK